MDSDHRNGSSMNTKNDTRTYGPNGTSLELLISLVDSDHETGTDSDSNINKRTLHSVKSQEHSQYALCSGSASDDFFQVDQKVLPRLGTSDVASSKSTGALINDDKFDDSNDPLYKLEESCNESASSTYRVSDVTHESLIPIISPTQSPPVQLIDRNDGYDSNRLPASIFTSKPSTPTEWSVASTESLFSIHIGNNSFSRDHIFTMGGNHYKSGELCKPEGLNLSRELQIFGETNRSHEQIELTQGSLEAKETDMNKSTNMENDSSVYLVSDSPTKNVLKIFGESGQLYIEESKYSSSAIHPSNESIIKGQSFSFPIKKKKKKKKCAFASCQCSNCSWALCYCTWSSCYCKWPTCCCKRLTFHCKRPGCSCKWLRWPLCSCKWFSWPSCSCKCISWTSCCKRLSCHCCICKWPTCCCKCPNWPSCRCRCPTCPSCCCESPTCLSCHCKCLTWPSCCCSCKCLSCCKCPTWRSCKWHCPECSCAFCSC